MEDMLVWVDFNDQETGYGGKLQTHQEKRLHRAFSVFVVHEGKMLIQKRAEGKYHSAGLWANACCSHPRKGEMLPEAVSRRMKEELGIAEDSCHPEELFSFIYYAPLGELCEYELDHVFLADYGGEIQCHPDEIAEFRWLELAELEKEMLEHPEKFCVWFLIAAPEVLRLLKRKKKYYREEDEVTKGEETILYLREYMERHLSEDLSLDVLAQKASMSKYHLSREFKKYTGCSPIKYLITLRLDKAKALLAETEMTITEIAEKVGFSDLNNFTNHFKKQTGMTPRNYRSSCEGTAKEDGEGKKL